MKLAKNWIIISGIVMSLALCGRTLFTGEDIPSGLKEIVMLTFGAGLGIEPAANLISGIGRKKEEKE
jgi:hypothetical protein